VASPLKSIIPALRVTHKQTRVNAFIVSKPDSNDSKRALVRVAIEGSTRYELWPLQLIEVRPTKEQHRNMGGEYDAPKGYPLCT